MKIELSHVGFWRFRQIGEYQPTIYVDARLPRGGCIYAFVVGKYINYIGETSFMIGRMGDYTSNTGLQPTRLRNLIKDELQRLGGSVEVCTLARIENRADRRLVESGLIERCKPIWNNRHSTDVDKFWAKVGEENRRPWVQGIDGLEYIDEGYRWS